MTTNPHDESARRLLGRVEAVAGIWLVALPVLRPLLWSGQPTDIPNLLLLVLLAAATTTGLLLRGLQPPASEAVGPWWRRPSTWGVAFLALAAYGSWMSPLPAAAWTLTCGWALHLAAPWALWPCIRRQPQLVVAGLLAGLAGELVVLVGQAAWERPALAAQLAGDPALSVTSRIADQYRVRIGSWRLEGTFLLANTLATWLLLLVPPLVAISWRSRRLPGWRWPLAASALAALAALAFSGSKAGILALGVAAALTWLTTLPSWRQRAPLVVAALAIGLIALTLPTLRHALAGSAGVRLDYWRAGAALVAERPFSGHGLEGFAVHYPRVKPPAGEETILAHQETLQAAVDLGLPAMLVLLGWWLALLVSLWPPRTVVPALGADAARLPPVALAGTALLLVFTLFAAGLLQANLAAWPGGLPRLWGGALIALLLMVAHHAARLPLPAPLACWCAVLACLLHVQADFSLHSMQVVGVLAWVACLGQALVRPPPSPVTAIASPRRQGLFAVAGLAVLGAVTAGIMASSLRGEVLDRAQQVEAIFARLRLAEAGRLDAAQRAAAQDAFEQAFGEVVVEGRQAVDGDPRLALGLGVIARAVAASRRFPADHDLVFAAVAIGEHLQALVPAQAATLTPTLEGLLAQWPGDLLVTKALSEHYLRLARVAGGERRHMLARQAQALAARTVALYPTHLPLRQTLIAAAELTGDAATVAQQRVEIERLRPLVHPDNRER